MDVTNDLSAITINALGGEMIDENIQETIVEILSERIRIAVIQTAKILVEGDPEIEILGDFLAETEEEIRPLLTTIGHAISVIMSTSHLEKNAIDVANPNRPNLTDRENSTGIKIRKKVRHNRNDGSNRKFRKARGKSSNHAHNRGPQPLNARARKRNRDD